ncbi:uncharacterized protein LOC113203501 isoform X1 [Frankliniella occidentalis]|uniref:Uncharacterized protein LOC113203501 isoform X1 n=1 Tax=Frankliniella occidentalis TaxID=133901 RepID=A0A6J1RYJ4_FRAOC|nr:uncharacterized protein LOC113203501 isoform X1 [Frankliniella occidentalis]XP_052130980.1 uncharacterized protein LOC113203501 isoform X1 [Frankliniella occidentalis]
MEVIAGDLADLPFQRRNVVEWSHRDQLTGALERARRETNHWSASTASAIHNYNKVVDQRALNLGDGRVQQTQRKQLEVFSTRVPGGSMQVIRSSTTSSSRSTVQLSQMGAGSWSTVPDMDTAFGDLQLSLHPLDLSSEKSKASVGRSIGWRRPPSRVARTNAANSAASNSASGAERQDGPKETRLEITVEDDKSEPSGPIISFPSDDDSSEKTASIITASSSVRNSSSRHSIVESRKSCSSENLVKVGVDISDAQSVDSGSSANGFLGRSSVLRRSLQYTRPPDFPTGTSVRRMREEIEARGGVSITSVPTSPSPTPTPASAKEHTLDKVKRLVSDSIATQNHSFVTVKSLNEVRGRLRSKVADDDAKPVNGESEEQPATDTLVSEDHVLRRVKETAKTSGPRVQSYVFGMENGRGASTDRADSPQKDKTTNGVRSEEWHRRRKSYGFETEVQNQGLLSLKESKEDSWSDSGATLSPLLKHIDVIKRSREAGRIPRPVSLYEQDPARLDSNGDVKSNGLAALRAGDEPATKRTVVNIVEDAEKATDMDRRRDVLRRRTEREISRQARSARSLTEPVSVSIPIVANDAVVVRADGGGSHDDPTPEPTLLINGFHYDQSSKSQETKRHSIAIVEQVDDDDSNDKVDANKDAPSLPRPADTYLSDSTEDAGHARKKRVEFSKTEVHFAAEPGRFNLVSTDDKPPPTNIVRGRRRQKLLAEQRINRSGLPEVRFGDTPLEQTTLAPADGEEHKTTAATGVITVTMEGKLSPDHPAERLQPTRTVEADDEKARGLVRCTVSAEAETPSGTAVPMWRSTVTLKNNSFASPTVPSNETTNDGQAEFQRLLKSLRPTGKRESIPSEVTPEVKITTHAPTVRSKGFSTKVTLVPETPGGFVSEHHTTHKQLDSSEQKNILHSLKLSRLALESTPLVLLANRPRRVGRARQARRPTPAEDEELSDDSLQADAEVRSYMVEKSSLAHLSIRGVSPPSPTSYSPILDAPLPITLTGPSYPTLLDTREHRSREHRDSVTEDGDWRYRHHASKAEKLVQLDRGLVDPQPRTASPNTVYIVPEQRKQSRFTDVGRAGLRTPSPVLPKSFSLVDSVTRRTDAATQVSRDDCERTVSVREILDRLAVEKTEGKERIIEVVSLPTKQVADAAPECRRSSPMHDKINGGTAPPLTDSAIFREQRPTSPLEVILSRKRLIERDVDGVQEGRVRSPGLSLAEEATRPRRGSPVTRNAANKGEHREFHHSNAPPGGHHIDVVERFLRSERERSHVDQVQARCRSRSPDGKGRLRPSREVRDIERRSRSRDPEVDDRSRELAEIQEKRRRSRSRDEIRAREARSHDTRRRSRSRDELDERVSSPHREARSRSRSQDELEIDRGHRHRSGSRDALEQRHRERSRDKKERHRSRSRDLLDATDRHRSESREVFEISKQRSRSRDGTEHKRGHHDSGRTSRSREELKDHVGLNGSAVPKASPEDKPGDWGRSTEVGHNGKERAPEAAERRHRCKCAERDVRDVRDAKGRVAAADRAGQRQAHKGEQAPAQSRRIRAAADQKADKMVRKTRTHVAAMASPIAHLVKPSKDRASSATAAPRRPGDVHLLMEPIRPVRRTAAPAKHSGSSNHPSTVANGTRAGLARASAQRRGTTSDSNSSLSQGKGAAPSRQGAEPLRERQERPARRSHRKHAPGDSGPGLMS